MRLPDDNLLYEWFAYFVFSNASCFCGITTEASMLTSSTRMMNTNELTASISKKSWMSR